MKNVEFRQTARGGLEFSLQGRPVCLLLTLSSVAELEKRLALSSIQTLIDRMVGGHFTSNDILAVAQAGLRGGGHREDEITQIVETDAPAGFWLHVVAELLVLTFADPGAPTGRFEK